MGAETSQFGLIFPRFSAVMNTRWYAIGGLVLPVGIQSGAARCLGPRGPVKGSFFARFDGNRARSLVDWSRPYGVKMKQDDGSINW